MDLNKGIVAPLRLLLLEDSPADAALLIAELRRAGLLAEVKVVETRAAYLENLDLAFHAIISDSNLPQFNARDALALLRAQQLDIPFIVVSGTIGEETAVALMKLGATDYLLKDRLGRLPQAVVQAVEARVLRAEQRSAREALLRQEKQYRVLFATYPSPTWVYDADTFAFLAVNDAAVQNYGYSREEFLAMTIRDIRPPEDIAALLEAGNVSSDEPQAAGVWRHRKKSGELILTDIYASAIQFEGRLAQLAIAIDVTAKKKAEDAIRESEERMRSVLESALDCVITMDHLGRVVEFNPAAEKTFGYKREGAIGQSLAELIIPPALREAHQSGLKRYLSNGEAGVLGKRVELTGMRSDRSEFPLELAITRIGSQEPPMFTGFIRDITERKQTEDRLREQARLLALAQDAIMVRDMKDRIEFWNHGAEKLYGWTAAEVQDREASDFLYEDEPAATGAARVAVVKNGEWTGECQHTCKDGGTVIVRSRWTLVRDELDAPKSILIINTDITEQKKTEETIRQSESRLRALVTSMEDIALEFDRDGTYIAIWTTKDALLPQKRSELIGRRMSDVHGEEVGERFISAFRHVAESRSAETINYTMDVVEGSRQFFGRISPIVNADGSCDRVCLLSRDVTQQKKLEAQFLRAQRVESIGTLASGVAHDLNNILAPILMGAAVLRRIKMPARDEAILSTIETCAQRGADIVKQVLTFARGADGERLLLQPAHLISDMARISQQTFPKTITVRTRLSESLWSIEGDPTQLHQVLLNLSVNARDAMPCGGTLTFSAENFPVDEHYASMTPGAKAGPHVLLEVNDTGMGITREVIDKIFDPFFTTKEIGHGTGLGLSTVIGIVKSHGGFLSVYSEIGRGTTFKMFLPARMSAWEAAQESEATPLPPAKGELLLIVDDEKPILQVARALLEGHGYQVLTAGDAAEALALFAPRMNEINLVLTDLAMPLMDGIALIRTLQKMKPDVRVIASTGRGGQELHAHDWAGLNVRECLTKPYNKGKLLTTLHDALI